MWVDEAQYSALAAGVSVTAGAGGAEVLDGAIALVGANRDRAAAFVDSELGAIEEVGGRSERLLETLEVFLKHGQRVANASAISGRHRDTVHRHLREIEDLLGCRIEERSADLLWALRLRRVFGGSSSRRRALR
jgi:DNA-binding PucR family transcriptional regulator